MIPLLALVAALGAPPEPPARFALVIGNNHALPGSGYETLSYADDDALRFADFFGTIGVETVLLAAPDAETAARVGELGARALRPTRRGFEEAITRLEAALNANEGRPRELYFVFSGHGSITASEAYLHLFDDKLTRTDLFSQVLDRLFAERVHVIIDSCHAYFLVNGRGERVAVAKDEEDLARYPHAGFLLSTSDRAEVQEWSGFRAGVFSYQVLGALRGAADVDLDGRVSYAEAHAYVLAANMAVRHADARIRPFVRQPAQPGAALMDLSSVPAEMKAAVPPTLSGRFYLVDAERGRLLDAHKPPGTPLTVVIPPREVSLHEGDQRYALLRTPGAVGDFGPAETWAASKGVIDDELRERLFAVPLTADFVRGVEAGSPQLTSLKVVGRQPVAWHDDPLTLSLLGAGVAAAVTGAVSNALFVTARDEADRRPITQASQDARDRAERWRGVMIGGYAAGGALILSGVLRAALTNEAPPAEITATAGPGGVGLSGRF